MGGQARVLQEWEVVTSAAGSSDGPRWGMGGCSPLGGELCRGGREKRAKEKEEAGAGTVRERGQAD